MFLPKNCSDPSVHLQQLSGYYQMRIQRVYVSSSLGFKYKVVDFEFNN